MTKDAWKIYPHIRFIRGFDIYLSRFLLRADVQLDRTMVGTDGVVRVMFSHTPRVNRHTTVKQWKVKAAERLARHLRDKCPVLLKRGRFVELEIPRGIETI